MEKKLPGTAQMHVTRTHVPRTIDQSHAEETLDTFARFFDNESKDTLHVTCEVRQSSRSTSGRCSDNGCSSDDMDIRGVRKGEDCII